MRSPAGRTSWSAGPPPWERTPPPVGSRGCSCARGQGCARTPPCPGWRWRPAFSPGGGRSAMASTCSRCWSGPGRPTGWRTTWPSCSPPRTARGCSACAAGRKGWGRGFREESSPAPAWCWSSFRTRGTWARYCAPPRPWGWGRSSCWGSAATPCPPRSCGPLWGRCSGCGWGRSRRRDRCAPPSGGRAMACTPPWWTGTPSRSPSWTWPGGSRRCLLETRATACVRRLWHCAAAG